MICTLEPLNDSVRFHVDRTHVVKNISHDRNDLRVGISIDEWFRDGYESRILKFAILSGRKGKSRLYENGFRKTKYGINLSETAPETYRLEKKKLLQFQVSLKNAIRVTDDFLCI